MATLNGPNETHWFLDANRHVEPIEYDNEDFALKGQQQTQMH